MYNKNNIINVYIDEIINPTGSEKFISGVLSYPNGELFAGSDETKSVYIWKAGIESPLLTYTGHTSAVNTMLLYSEKAELYSGLKGGMIVLWDLSTSKIKLNLQGHSTVITAMSIYQFNNAPLILASASGEGKIKLWDLKSKTPTTNLKGNFCQVDCLSFSPDFNYLASGTQDGSVKIWDIRQTNKFHRELTSTDKKPINCIQFNPIEKMMAFGSKDKTVKYYDCDEFVKVAQTTCDRLPIEHIHFDKKGDSFFIATNEALKYWRIMNNTKLKLVDMFETGWSKLQSFRAIDGKGVYGLSSFGNKLSYYHITYEQLFKDNRKTKSVPFMPDITEDVRESNESTFYNNESFQQKINNINISSNKKPTNTNNNISNNILPPDLDNFMDSSVNKFESGVDNKTNASNMYEPLGISEFIDNISNMSITVTKEEPNSNMTKNDIVFIKNTVNMMNNNNVYNNESNINKIQIEDINNNRNINFITTPDSLNELSNEKPLTGEILAKEIDNSISNFTPTPHKEIDSSNIINPPITPTNKNENEIPIDANTFHSNIPPVETSSEKGFPDFHNLESKADISVIQQSNQNIVEESFLEDPLFLLSNTNNPSQKDQQSSNSSFLSYRSNAPMGIDLNQFIKASTSMNETVHPISQSHDLAIIEEINTHHNAVRQQISTRYNNIKVFFKHWEQSNIDSTLYGLKMTKDLSAANDFFKFAILARKDVSKIPFTLDHYLTMLKLIRKQFDAGYETYSKTGCKIGGLMIQLLNDKIAIAKKGANHLPVNMQKEDPFIHERIEKCDLIIEEFRGICNRVKHIVKKAKKKETIDLMNTFIMELDFFLKPFSSGGPEIKIANGN